LLQRTQEVLARMAQGVPLARLVRAPRDSGAS
jgi:hypothetical protein